MKLIEEILRENNLEEAIKRVKASKVGTGVDKMTVEQIDSYFEKQKENMRGKKIDFEKWYDIIYSEFYSEGVTYEKIYIID